MTLKYLIDLTEKLQNSDIIQILNKVNMTTGYMFYYYTEVTALRLEAKLFNPC